MWCTTHFDILNHLDTFRHFCYYCYLTYATLIPRLKQKLKAIKLEWLLLNVVTGNENFAKEQRVEALYGNRNALEYRRWLLSVIGDWRNFAAQIGKAAVDESIEPKVSTAIC